MSSAWACEQQEQCPYHGAHQFLVNAFGPAERAVTGYFGDRRYLKIDGWDKENAILSFYTLVSNNCTVPELNKTAKDLHDNLYLWNTRAYEKTCMDKIAFYYFTPKNKQNSCLQVGCLNCNRMTDQMFFVAGEHEKISGVLNAFFKKYLDGTEWCRSLVEHEHRVAKEPPPPPTSPPPPPPPAPHQYASSSGSQRPPLPAQVTSTMTWLDGGRKGNGQSKRDDNGSDEAPDYDSSDSYSRGATADVAVTSGVTDGDRGGQPQYRCYHEDRRHVPEVFDDVLANQAQQRLDPLQIEKRHRKSQSRPNDRTTKVIKPRSSNRYSKKIKRR